ncbi:MAG: tyrosine-type recombinase/integrase [Proteobacteria bacterium]|nr:tyrosine-type recombinase/integrase [Pseudomonadota bacterium]
MGHEETARFVRCSAVILATGRFLGRGLRADRHQVRESIFDLPVSQPANRSEWHSRDFCGRHPINRAGLRVDPDFRPLAGTGAAALVVKRTAEAAGLDPARFSGHSLRAGFATSAAARGVNTFSIMDQTGHKRTDTLKRYVRLGNLFRNNAAAQVGL